STPSLIMGITLIVIWSLREKTGGGLNRCIGNKPWRTVNVSPPVWLVFIVDFLLIHMPTKEKVAKRKLQQ
ncbi:MAG: hypothetical protein ACJAVW_002641, partial [Spirosomataceae bacterium]